MDSLLSEPAAGHPVRVLLVEDYWDAAQSLAMLLRFSGYDVCVRHSAAQGLEAALNFHPQIAILDIGLPGMDGWELAGHIREQMREQTPVFIALTCYGSEEDRRKSAAVGFQHHLTKTTSPAELLSILQSVNRRTG
jgi:two-component system, sensor histidine kinase